MPTLDPRFWVWGYTLDRVPGRVPFVNQSTRCSLETAAAYLGCGSAFWMNGAHDLDAFADEDALRRLAHLPQVVCALTHIEENGPGKGGWKRRYVEAAAKIGELSRKHPNIVGAIIDDFLHETGPSRDMPPAELHEVNAALKAANPNLKLYVVHYYGSQTPDLLAPFAADLDVIVAWAWHSTDYFWKTLYDDDLRHLRERLPACQIIQGMFVNAYGDGDFNTPQPMDQLELQCQRIAGKLDAGLVEGWCALQNGHLCFESHRRQAIFLKEYWEWYRGTRTPPETVGGQ